MKLAFTTIISPMKFIVYQKRKNNIPDFDSLVFNTKQACLDVLSEYLHYYILLKADKLTKLFYVIHIAY